MPSNWVSDSDFSQQNPISGVVTAVEVGKNQWGGQEVNMFFRFGLDDIRSVTLYKSNLLYAIKAWGQDTDKWIGKLFLLQQEEDSNGKKVKRIIIR